MPKMIFTIQASRRVVPRTSQMTEGKTTRSGRRTPMRERLPDANHRSPFDGIAEPECGLQARRRTPTIQV